MKKTIIGWFIVCWLVSGVAWGEMAGPAGRDYEAALELFRAGQYGAAQQQFERAKRQLTPDDESLAEGIAFYLAVCAAENGADDADRRLTDFLARYPGTTYANRAHRALGSLYQSRGRYAEAIAQFDRVNPAALSPAGRSEFYFDRGYALFQAHDYPAAVGEFDRVGEDRVYGPSATYYKAYIAYQTGDLAAARAGFDMLAGVRGYAPVVPFYLLHIDFLERDYRAVVTRGPAVLRSASSDRRAEALRVIGEAYYRLHEYPEALRYLDEYAVAKGTSLSRPEEYLLGYSAYKSGALERAIDHLGRVATGQDALAQNAGLHIGSASLELGDKARAQQAFSLAMRLDADRAVKEEAMFNFLQLEYESGGGMFQQSIETIDRFLAEFPDSPHRDQARGLLTAAYLNNKNYEAAYQAVTQIRNPDADTRAALQKIAYYRGLEYFIEGNYEGAGAMFETAAANRSNARLNALTRFWQAEVYYRQGQYLRAVPLYQDYIVLSPKGERENTLAHYNLAYSYFNLQNVREAKSWFERFLAADPSDNELKADTYNRLGDIEYLNRNYAGAVEQYARTIVLGGREADYARFQRAMALGLSASNAQKIAALQPIASSASDYAPAALYELGATYRKQEQFEQAAATLRNFIERYPDSPYYLNALIDLGLISQNRGRNDEAMTYYKEVVDRYPNSAQARDALSGIRDLYADTGDMGGYFAYAASEGMETDVSAIERDSLTFHVAERIHLQGDTRRSLPLMQAYLSQFPQGNYAIDAAYYMAEGQLQAGDTEAALAGFERVIAGRYSRFTPDALQKAAAINYDRGNFAAAADRYRRLSEESTNRSTLESALSGYIRSVAQAGDPQQTIAAAETVLASDHANEEIRLEAQYALGKAWLALDDRERALAAFREASGVRTRAGAEAQYEVIRLLYESGRTDEAEEQIYAFSETNTSHARWLAKSFLLLGDIYLGRGNAFQAKATWQSVVDGYPDPSDGILDEARARLNTIQ